MEHFIDILKEYLSTENTDYAYILNGSWGTGKTYYIKEQVLNNDKLQKDYKILYYSLNGITDIKKVIKSIYYLIASEGVIGSEVESLISESFDILDDLDTGKSNAIFKVLNKFKDKGLNLAVSKKELSNYLIIIDDVERKSKKLPIADLLGQIYSSLIEKNAKVLFISDESKIEEDEYKDQKEKFIRRTIYYKRNNTELYSLLLKERNLNDSFFLEILSEIDGAKSNKVNLRTVIFTLDLFSSIYKIYNNTSTGKYLDIKKYFYPMLIFCLELKNGKIPENEVYKISKINIHYNSEYSNKPKGDEKSWLIKYFEKYNTLEHELNLPTFIINYIIDGFLDEEKMKKSLVILQKEEQYQVLDLLKYFYDYEIVYLLSILKTIKDYISKDLYKYNDFIDIYEYLLMIKDKTGNKVDIGELEQIMLDKIEEYKDKIEKEFNGKIIDTDPFNNLASRNIIDKKIKSFQKNIVSKVDKEDFINLFDSFLNDDRNKFTKIYLNSNTDNFFSNIDDLNLYSKFEKINNKTINYLKSIISEKILRVGNAGVHYLEYIGYLKKIKNAINGDTSDPLKELLLEELRNKIDEAIYHLEHTTK